MGEKEEEEEEDNNKKGTSCAFQNTIRSFHGRSRELGMLPSQTPERPGQTLDRGGRALRRAQQPSGPKRALHRLDGLGPASQVVVVVHAGSIVSVARIGGLGREQIADHSGILDDVGDLDGLVVTEGQGD